MNLLHISDLHFNYREDKTEQSRSKNHMANLIAYLSTLAKEMKFDYIFITGDIGFSGSHDDYSEMKVFVDKLLTALTIDKHHVFLCPGNHDVDREFLLDKIFPDTKTTANQLLKIERLGNLSPAFINYSAFCEDMEFCKYKIGDDSNHLVGVFNAIDSM